MNMRGLTDKQVIASRQKYGTNEMPRPKLKTAWQFFAEVFQDKLNIILLVMMCMFIGLAAMGYGSVYEAIGIGVVLFVVAITTVVTKVRGQKNAEELRIKSSLLYANVLRNGHVVRINSTDVVVDDIVILRAGETICADGYVIDGTIAVNNAILNGESDECEKHSAPENYKYNRQKKVTADDYTDGFSVFGGTTVLAGECKMRVARVGHDTENAKIMTSLHSIDEVKTTLQIQLDNLAEFISKVGGACAVVIFLVLLAVNINTNGMADGASVMYMIFSALTVALTIFVAAVPEGLPFIISIITSQNVSTMIKNNILAKKPSKIPEAGNIQLLCTDKTGTLTRGFLEPVGNFMADGTDIGFDRITGGTIKSLFMQSVALTGGATFDDNGGIIGGNLTSRALMGAVQQDADHITEIQANTHVINRMPFDSKYKFSATQTDKKITFIMGAPEVVLAHAKNTINSVGEIVPLDRRAINKLIKQNAMRAMRIIAFAFSKSWVADEQMPDDLVLISVVTLRDQVRDGVTNVVGALQESGVQVMMITGDILDTARAIGVDCGIIKDDTDIAITASDFDKMSDADAKRALPHIKVIARAMPETKLRVVKLAQSLGLCIGMCGDGTNDAPALKRADVGFAMGDGTDVCKESCDIIITDNNFLSIANCILLGRTFVHNVISFLKFQLPINFALVILSVLFPIMVGFDAFTAVQILIINIVMDSLNSLAFGGEPGHAEYMREPAQGKNAPLLTRNTMGQIAWTTIGFVCVFGLMELPCIRNTVDSASVYMSMRFALLVIMAIVNGFCVRASGFNILRGLRKNPMFVMVAFGVVACTVLCVSFGGAVLQLAPLNITQWAIVFGLALLIIPINWLRQMFVK